MCVRVAQEFGRSLSDVAGDSYALTLFSWGHVVAAGNRDRLVRQGERIGDAVYVAVAVNDPKKLQTIGRDYEKAIGLGGDPVTSDPTFIEKAKAWMLNGEQVIGSPEPQPGGID